MTNPEEFLRRSVEDSLQLKKLFFEKHAPQVLALHNELLQIARKGGKALIFGNGGSAADAQHFASELIHRVETKPLGIRAIALHTDTSLLTAIGNDEGFETVFARQISVLADPGDLAIGISTSGTSTNIVEGLRAAQLKNCRTAGLLGRDGGKARELCDLALIVPHLSTPRIQEVHGMIIHLVCQLLERTHIDS